MNTKRSLYRCVLTIDSAPTEFYFVCDDGENPLDAFEFWQRVFAKKVADAASPR